MQFSQALPLIQDLDIILFRGTEFVSEAIVNLQRITMGVGSYSHCGLVISKKHLSSLNIATAVARTEEATKVVKEATAKEALSIAPKAKVSFDDPDNTKYIWESTMSSTNKAIDATTAINVETGKPFFGVQIRKLEDVVVGSLKSGAGVSWLKLINNPLLQDWNQSDADFEDQVEKVEDQLKELHQEYYLRPYPLNVARIARSLFSCLSCVSPLDAKGAVFCSQFVALVYQKLGVLDSKYHAGEIVPEDFADQSVSIEKLARMVQEPVVLEL